MIGDIDWFGRIVGAVPDGDITWNAKVAKALIREGLAVVLIEPGGKRPVCTLTARDAKKADTEAKEKAKENGSPNWDKVRHECGIAHAITEERMLTRTRVKYWLGEGANIAVAPGAGSKRVIIVDVDTESERDAFLERLAYELPDDSPSQKAEAYPLTVSSPGVKNVADGEENWVHKNGGHFWFNVPEDVELPQRPGRITWCACHGFAQPQGGCGQAWAAYYGSGYVLVPPSVRPEGPYRLTGSVQKAPEWLLGIIVDAGSAGRSEAVSGELGRFSDDPIDQWSADTSWFSLLTEDGFTPHDHDTCGCPTFTRPGDPTHGKSVTAHELGCAKYDTSKGHGPLRVWSDAMGAGTMSKLSYVAKFRHGGDMGSAMRELGIETRNDDGDDLFVLGDISPKGDAPENGATKVDVTSDDRFAPINWDELFAEDFEKAEFLPGQLLEIGQQIALIGDGKAGKSLFMAEWCFKAITGSAFLTQDVCAPLTVMYLDAENSRRDLVMRLRSLGATPGILNGKLIYLSFPPFKPLDSKDGADQVMRLVEKYRPDVVVLDTVSRFIQGKENDSDTWLALYRLLHGRLKALRVAGIRLDHFGKDAEKGGRGSSSKSQDVDHVWELKVDEEGVAQSGNHIEVQTRLTLRRTHTRTGLGADRMSIERRGLKTRDEKEWLPGETRHALADVFDAGFGDTPEPEPRPIETMREVCRTLQASANGMPLRELRDSVSGKASTIDRAIRQLIEEGCVKKERVGKAHIHTFLKEPSGEKV